MSAREPRAVPTREELEAKVAELQAEIDAARAEAVTTRRDLDRDLDRAHRRARRLEQDLRKAKTALARLKRRRLVRLAFAANRGIRAPARIGKVVADRGTAACRRVVRQLGLSPAVDAIAGPRRRRQGELGALIRASLPEAPAASGRVSVLVEARTDAKRLRACLRGLLEADWADLEVFVVGPAADRTLRAATRGEEWSSDSKQRIRSVGGESFGDARQEALAIASGERILFLHDDVRPLEPTWLRRMVAVLDERQAGAVGARLLLPTGAQGRNVPRTPAVESLGLEFGSTAGIPRPQPVGFGSDPLDPAAGELVERPAASEACLLVARTTLDKVGLPQEDLEEALPVGLCLEIRASGRPILIEGSAVLWHWNAVAELEASRMEPEQPLGLTLERWAPRLIRSILLDRLRTAGRWSSAPLHVGITLTRDDEAAGYGDWYTAHELGAALEHLGWRVSYLERHRDRWYEGAGECDVLVSLLQTLDLFRVPRHVVTVAWIRNWTEEWIAKPWFGNYDIVLTSSGRAKEVVEAQSPKTAQVFPIATNPARFNPRRPRPEMETEAAFVGSHWGVDREVAAALPELARKHRVGVYGRGWEDVPRMAELSRGLAAYDDLPDVYASTAVAIDDAAISTKPHGSVNSRVFDALAAGTIVVSNNELGVRELFDDEFPTWRLGTDLASTVEGLLADPGRRSALLERYRSVVLERHTYERRAEQLRDIVEAWVSATRFAVHIGPQTWDVAQTWGDLPFGRDVQQHLERRGFPTALLVSTEAPSAASLRADVALHVFGVRAPHVYPGQVSALWVISHPDRVTESLCERYDVVFSASDMLMERLEPRVRVPLVALHQATEPERFYPDPTGPHHQLLFVGSSRKVPRPIIEALRGSGFDLSVYGRDWTSELLDPEYLKGEWVPNDELRRYYSSADVVLNDHWGDMRDLGIISNRIYDALACGAFVVSDRVPGLDAEFDGAVVSYGTREELHELLRRYLADPAARAEAGSRGQAAVLDRHTFGHRADRLVAELIPLALARPRTMDEPVGHAAGG